MGGGLRGPRMGGGGLVGKRMGKGSLTGGMVGGPGAVGGVEKNRSVKMDVYKECCHCVRVLATFVCELRMH
jgi:hypothetical protein